MKQLLNIHREGLCFLVLWGNAGLFSSEKAKERVNVQQHDVIMFIKAPVIFFPLEELSSFFCFCCPLLNNIKFLFLAEIGFSFICILFFLYHKLLQLVSLSYSFQKILRIIFLSENILKTAFSHNRYNQMFLYCFFSFDNVAMSFKYVLILAFLKPCLPFSSPSFFCNCFLVSLVHLILLLKVSLKALFLAHALVYFLPTPFHSVYSNKYLLQEGYGTLIHSRSEDLCLQIMLSALI